MMIYFSNNIYTIQTDEMLYSIDEMLTNEEIIKASMIEERISQPERKVLLDLCKVSHSGLIYRIHGNHSQSIIKIDITCDEIP